MKSLFLGSNILRCNARSLCALVFVSVILFSEIVPVYHVALCARAPANAMWIEPNPVIIPATIGYSFNVTVWVNVTSNTYVWNFMLLFNPTYFRVVGVGYTAGSKSMFFQGHGTIPVTPEFDNNLGWVKYGESLVGADHREPGCASLSWVEFELKAVPPENQTVSFTDLNYDTFVLDPDLNLVPMDAFYETTVVSGARVLWQRTYGGPNWESGQSVVQTGDGGFAVAGDKTDSSGTEDFWLVKTDSAGIMEWNHTYGGTNDDIGYSVIQTLDGGYAVTGTTWSFGAGGGDFWLVKTDSAGIMEWNHTYGGTTDDFAYSAVQTIDGGYAIAGMTKSFGAGGGDFWLVKTDSAGTMQWNHTYGGVAMDVGVSLVQASGGGYAIAGTTLSFGAGGGDFWLVKTDSAGTMQWNHTYGGAGWDTAQGLVQASDGGYAIAGTLDYSGASKGSYWLVKTDSAGIMEWNQTYGGTGYDRASSLTLTLDNGYAIVGCTTSFGAGGWDFWLVKTDSAGIMEWGQTYGGVAQDLPGSVIQTLDGDYVMAGGTMSFGAGEDDVWLVRYGTLSVSVWPSSITVARGQEFSVNVTLDCAENLFAYEFSLSFNNSVLSAVSVEYTGYLGTSPDVVLDPIIEINNTLGYVSFAISRLVLPGVTGGGVLATVHFKAVGTGISPLSLYDTILADDSGVPIDHETEDGLVTVLPAANLVVESIVVVDQGCIVYANDTYADGVTFYHVPVEVTVKNDGIEAAGAFNVSLAVYSQNGSLVEDYVQWRVSGLAADETAKLTYGWHPLHTGSYNLYAVVDSHNEVPESNETDNTFVLRDLPVALMGDLDGSHRNDVLDIVQVGLSWHSHPSDPTWNIQADLNHDGYINILDIIRVPLHWHQTW